jgi:acyl-CoA thioesterase FadM
VIAMLADAAMTHCLFKRGIQAVTGKLRLRYPRPVEVGLDATVKATITKCAPPLFELAAEIWQAGVVRVTAESLFIEQKPVGEAK